MKTKAMILGAVVAALLAGCSAAPPSTSELKQALQKKYDDLGALSDLSCSVNKDMTKGFRAFLSTQSDTRKDQISFIKKELGSGADEPWVMSCISEGRDVVGFISAGRGPDGKIHIWEIPEDGHGNEALWK